MFNSEHATAATNRHNRLAWVRAVRALGSKWIYAESVKLVKKQEALTARRVDWNSATV